MTSKSVLAGTVVLCVLAACGNDSRSDSSPEDQSNPGTSDTKLAVPGLYDANKGWRIEVREEPAILPHSKAVAVWRGERLDEGAFAVLDATTGKARWSRQRYARWTRWPPTSSSELIREENMA